MVPVDNINYQKGDLVTVQGNPYNLSKAGRSFTGWNSQADGNGLNFVQGETFFIGSFDVILYARWSDALSFTVTYNGNGAYTGVAPLDTTTYEPGMRVLIPGNAGRLYFPGFSFSGWNTKSDGTGVTYTQGQYMTMGSCDVILYARWTTALTYVVTYDANNADTGSVPVDSTNYESGRSVTVMGNTGNLRRVGYSFSGWNTKADGSGINCLPGQSFFIGGENVVLYARWVNGYSVTYNSNGADSGSVPVDTTYYPQNATVTVLGNIGILEKNGYSFVGWNTKADGSGSTYRPGQSFPMGTANVILYAMWSENLGYTVTYDGNGATGGEVPIDNTSYASGQMVSVAGNKGFLARTGFIFLGWNTKADGSGDSYTEGDFFMMERGDVKLYAMWGSSGSIDLTFNPGSGADNEITGIALQPDGKIIIVGDFTTYNGTPRNRVARLNSNGSIDLSFNPGTGANDSVYGVAIQPDGKVLIVGSFTLYNGVARNRIVRINSDGSLDETFDPGIGADNTVNCVAIQRDGKIIIGGAFTNYNGTVSSYLARLKADGSYDFGFDVSSGPDNEVNSISIQSDNRIIIGGAFLNCGGEGRSRIARLEEDGSLDISFDPGVGADDEIYVTELQTDGKIILGGIFNSYGGSGKYIARSNYDGTKDSVFISSGAGPDYEIYSIAIQSDGKIIIGGNFGNYDSISCSHLARLNANGTLDTSFETSNGPDSTVSCIAVQSDGKILVGGEFITYNGIRRHSICRVMK
jgi:uncharacterized delta-60 repeat protein/uncharacterized repeat protein (TIGR02543 family)